MALSCYQDTLEVDLKEVNGLVQFAKEDSPVGMVIVRVENLNCPNLVEKAFQFTLSENVAISLEYFTLFLALCCEVPRDEAILFWKLARTNLSICLLKSPSIY